MLLQLRIILYVTAVTLTGTENTFRGFAVQSLAVPGGAGVGTFVPAASANQQILACGGGAVS